MPLQMKLPGVPDEELDRFCERWRIRELSVFGSAARGELDEESDIDLLVVFDDDADWSLLDHVDMEEDLSEIAGRDVDLITRRSIERSRNWIRRDDILSSSELVYAEG